MGGPSHRFGWILRVLWRLRRWSAIAIPRPHLHRRPRRPFFTLRTSTCMGRTPKSGVVSTSREFACTSSLQYIWEIQFMFPIGAERTLRSPIRLNSLSCFTACVETFAVPTRHRIRRALTTRVFHGRHLSNWSGFALVRKQLFTPISWDTEQRRRTSVPSSLRGEP